jgi:hypothetical protein
MGFEGASDFLFCSAMYFRTSDLLAPALARRSLKAESFSL